jgi:hypothetical protein
MYGWNSEDDAYFPTRGSSFSFGIGWGPSDEGEGVLMFLGLGYRVNWRLADRSFLKLTLGGRGASVRDFAGYFSQSEDSPFALSYSYDLRRGVGGDSWIQSCRAYVEPGFAYLAYLPSAAEDSRWAVAPSAKTGVTLDTKHLGIINLFFVVKHEVVGQAR